MSMFANGLKHMAPGQEIRALVGTFMEIRKEPFTINVAYRSKERRLGKPRVFADQYFVDVRQFDGQWEIGGDPAKDAVKALKEIAVAVKQVSLEVRTTGPRVGSTSSRPGPSKPTADASDHD